MIMTGKVLHPIKLHGYLGIVFSQVDMWALKSASHLIHHTCSVYDVADVTVLGNLITDAFCIVAVTLFKIEAWFPSSEVDYIISAIGTGI